MNAQEQDIDFPLPSSLSNLRVRRFKGREDFALMSDISMRSWKADAFDFMKTGDDIESAYKEDPKRDPGRELIFIESGDKVIAYGEASFMEKSPQDILCYHYAHVLPEHRSGGLRQAMKQFNERHLRRTFAEEHSGKKGMLYSWALSEPNNWQNLLMADGYTPSWHLFEMVRPNLDDIPDLDLPRELTVRPITEDDYRRIWEATKETFIGQPWSFDEMWDEAHYRQWLKSTEFMPDLWQIAWDGDEVAGSVQSYIDEDENRSFQRRRGHTERIFVAPAWRGKGVARALIARSLKDLRERGMTEAVLDTEEANVHEAYRLYQSMGYQIVYQFTWYQKSL